MSEKIVIIIPMHNEEQRFKPSHVAEWASRLHFVLVNDGSSDQTNTLIDGLSRFMPNAIHALHLEKNAGKAEAVRQGVKYALSHIPGVDWIGYWDADFSTRLEEVERFIHYASLSGGVDLVAGSRIRLLGSHIERRFQRHACGLLFSLLVKALFHIKAYDTQCGAKLFTVAAAQRAFRHSFVSRWIFDVEILLRLRGCRMVECPLINWRDVKGSKISVRKDAPRILRDLVKIALWQSGWLKLPSDPAWDSAIPAGKIPDAKTPPRRQSL